MNGRQITLSEMNTLSQKVLREHFDIDTNEYTLMELDNMRKTLQTYIETHPFRRVSSIRQWLTRRS